MSKSINVNVSSGTVAIGGVIQGNNSHINVSQVQSNAIDNEVDGLLLKLNALAAPKAIAAAEIELVTAQVKDLAVAAKSDDRGKGGGILKAIKENFSWAYPAFKDFAGAVWPAILIAVGA